MKRTKLIMKLANDEVSLTS